MTEKSRIIICRHDGCSIVEGDCRSCPFHKGMAKGVKIPGEYGKCIRPEGICSRKVKRSGRALGDE